MGTFTAKKLHKGLAEYTITRYTHTHHTHTQHMYASLTQALSHREKSLGIYKARVWQAEEEIA